MFGVDMSSSLHILIVGIGPNQGLDDATLTAEAKYLINFSNERSDKIYKSIKNIIEKYINSKWKILIHILCV